MNNQSYHEKMVLGCIILENLTIYKAVSILDESDFKVRENAITFKVLKKLIIDEKKKGVDVIALREAINEEIEPIYFTDLAISPSEALIDNHITAVKNNSVRIKLQSLLFCSQQQVKTVNNHDFFDWLNKLENSFTSVMDEYRKHTIKNSYNPATYIPEAMAKFEYYKNNPLPCRGIPTGFKELDAVTKGLRRMNIISAVSGTGKSVLAMNIAVYVALQRGIKTLYLNYEMDREDLVRRMVSIISEVPSAQIYSGMYSHPDYWQRVKDFSNLIKETETFFLTGQEEKTIHDTVNQIYYHKKHHDIQVVFIDYLGEIYPDRDSLKEGSEYITYGRYCQKLKNVCSELDIACVLVTQQGRQGEQSHSRDKIQGSWKLIQKADLVLICYYDTKEQEFIIKIDKQRDGMTNYEIRYTFKKNIHKLIEIGPKDQSGYQSKATF